MLILLGMKLSALDAYFSELLDLPRYSGADSSLNGLQVGDLSTEVGKVAFAVDTSMETIRRATAIGADCLFVHHGLFWGKPGAISGVLYDRIRALIQAPLALYAAHLPLDLHPAYGNNISIVRQLGLDNIAPFGEYRGIKIGYKGTLPSPLALDGVLSLLELPRSACLSVLPFGGSEISTIAVVSGGAATTVEEAIGEDVDLYITGETTHQIYYSCLEGGINFVAGGHYFTETYGVRALARLLNETTDLEAEFIDLPTGL